MRFYYSYTVALKGISGFTINYSPAIEKDVNEYRIDAHTITAVKIPIPTLRETVLTPDTLLSKKSYLLIQNNSTSSFELHRGSGTVPPDNLPNSLINPGEGAQYAIDPGIASVYKL